MSICGRGVYAVLKVLLLLISFFVIAQDCLPTLRINNSLSYDTKVSIKAVISGKSWKTDSETNTIKYGHRIFLNKIICIPKFVKMMIFKPTTISTYLVKNLIYNTNLSVSPFFQDFLINFIFHNYPKVKSFKFELCLFFEMGFLMGFL